MNKKQELVLIIFLFLILISVLLFTTYYYSKINKECLNSPIKFGLDKFTKLNGAQVNCVCYTLQPEIMGVLINSGNITIDTIE